MSSWQQAVSLDLAKGKKRKDSLVVLNGNQQKNLRTGRDECDMAEWICDNCDTAMPGFYQRCSKCEILRPEQRATRRELRAKEGEIGRGGGWKERQSEDDRREWNSDGEEYDDFGRKKKRRSGDAPAAKVPAQSSKGDRQQAALERLRRKGRKDND
ncbi:caiD [Symbiodinium natans]|uniref:CaiD protein n=1 Tax=Symbiodinium natans TaxID=878477 RepID=A0A812J2F2_9DINO|nr:caiD [Symbiodinium natans]